ncbi:MAG: hypothetical protein K8H99_04665 [Nitrospirae bacterium]|nr:hypothetical protein [Fimbriimonadaceae bacterium]
MSSITLGQPNQNVRANELVLARVVGLVALLLVAGHLLLGTFQPHVRFHPVLYLSLFAVFVGLRVKGWEVFERTQFDFFFVGWLVLAALSQLYATNVLGRVIYALDILEYLYVILQSWAVYRGAFALVKAAPRAGSQGILFSILAICMFSALLGIAQSTGAKGAADTIANNLGSRKDVTQMSEDYDESPRPSGLLSSPTMLGSYNVYGTIVTIAIAIAFGFALSIRQLPWLLLANGVLLACSVTSQVRLALIQQFGLLAFFAVYTLFRAQRTVAAVAVLAFAFGLIAFNRVVVERNDPRFQYITRTFEGKFFSDESLTVRLEAWNRIGDVATELAPLGSGFTQLTSNAYARRGDVFARANGPDNGFLEAYLIHGIPGILLVMFLIYTGFSLQNKLKGVSVGYVQMIRWSVLLSIVVFPILSSGLVVTHSKFERSGYLLLLMGAAAALVSIAASRERLEPPPAAS